MIVCNSTVAGFKLIIGCLSIHLGMFLTLVIFVPPLKGQENYEDLNGLWNRCVIVHSGLVIINLANMFPGQVS